MRAGCEKVDVTISGRDIERKGARVRDPGGGRKEERNRLLHTWWIPVQQCKTPRLVCTRETT